MRKIFKYRIQLLAEFISHTLWTQVSKISKFALNMRIVKLVSKLSLVQGLKTVFNLVSNLSQNLR